MVNKKNCCKPLMTGQGISDDISELGINIKLPVTDIPREDVQSTRLPCCRSPRLYILRFSLSSQMTLRPLNMGIMDAARSRFRYGLDEFQELKLSGWARSDMSLPISSEFNINNHQSLIPGSKATVVAETGTSASSSYGFQRYTSFLIGKK